MRSAICAVRGEITGIWRRRVEVEKVAASQTSDRRLTARSYFGSLKRNKDFNNGSPGMSVAVSLRSVRKAFGTANVIYGVDLEIAPGEFLVLVGPSGCGKSTLLRMIAGLEDVTSGDILIDGEIVNDVDPADRDIAMVFQSYALYPHMSVRENLAFGLNARGFDAREK